MRVAPVPLLCLAVATAALPPRLAQAAPSRDEAQALFEAARSLMAQGRFDEACPKLEASEAIDPGIGTEVNLARCYELSGRLATAYATYQRAISEMHAAGQANREAVAERLADALRPLLAHVMLAVREEGAEPGLELRLDGAPVERALWGHPVAVDPGAHFVVASSPAFRPWQGEFTIDHDAQSVTIEIPRLAPVSPLAAPLFPSQESPAPSGRPRGSLQRPLAVAVGGLGVVGLGLGAYFGVTALSKNAASASECGVGGVKDDCYPTAAALRREAVGDATASTVFRAVGGVAVAAGLVLWLTAPSQRAVAGVELGPRGLRVEGTF